MSMSKETWVNNVRKKLEDICMDLDEFICKEPVLFVGNQIETVGANMKKFFSGFVVEFVSTKAVDPVQHVAQLTPSKCNNLVETSTNSVVEIKENTVDINPNNQEEAPLVSKELCHKPSSTGLCYSEQVTLEISQYLFGENDSLIDDTPDNTTQANLNCSTDIQNLDNGSEEEGVLDDESSHSDATAHEYSDWGIENILDLDLDIENMVKGEPLMIPEEKKTRLNGLNDDLECDSNTSIAHQSSELESSITCNENKEENPKLIIAGGVSSEKLCEPSNTLFRNPTVEQETIDCNPKEAVDYLSVSSDILSSYGSFTTLAYDSYNEESCSGTGLGNCSIINFEDINKDTDESCVIVEGGKLSVFPNRPRSKSYKKMIQDTFMSRKRLTKEYKQLAVLCGDIDKELGQQTQESSKLPVQGLPNSEWELL